IPVNSSLSCSCQFIQSTLGASIEIVLQTDVVSLFAETISFAVHHLLVPNGLGFLSPPVNIKVSGREHQRREVIWNWPTLSDRVHVEGLWIWDRGHPPADTEIHSPRLVAIQRH